MGTPGLTESGYQFEGFRLDSGGKLYLKDAPVDLTEKEAKLLREMVVHAGQVITYAQLRQILGSPEENAVGESHQILSALEQRLGLSQYIRPVYRRGFRFCCNVKSYGAEQTRFPRLAILPFAQGAGGSAYLAEALTEETGRRLKALCPSPSNVLEPDSVFTLARRGMSPAQIGSALQADLVLEGAIQALPGRFRLRAEMLQASDGGSLWCEDMVLAQMCVSCLAKELAHRVEYRMGGVVSLAAAEDVEDDPYSPEACELFWRARFEWKTLQRHQMQDGLQKLQRVVELAPRWVEARAELVNLCLHQATYGFMAPRAAASLIRRHARDVWNNGSEALLPAWGWVCFHIDRNLPAAQQAFDRAACFLHNRWVTQTRVLFALSLRRFGQAIEMLENCIRLDPYSAGLHARLAWALHLAGETAKSLERIQYALQEFPDHELTKLFAVSILAFNGDANRAVAVAEDQVHRSPYLDPALSVYAYALACAGRRQEAQAQLEQLEWLGRERYVLRAFTPAAYVALGNFDAAMEELRICDEQRCPWFFQMLADPRLAPLRARSDFQVLEATLPQMEAEASKYAKPADGCDRSGMDESMSEA